MLRSAAVLLLISGSFAASPLFAQTGTSDHPVARAERLMNEGKTAAAVQLLEAHVKSHPGDAAAQRLLGRALYWSGKSEASRSHYEAALRLEPDNHGLRLEYARVLVESYSLSRARVIMAPLRNHPEAAADAEALLGTLEYWEGDWTAAAGHFRAALQRNPRHAEARRQLNEIRMTTAPSVSVTSEYASDTQPMQRLIFGGEGTWNVTPLQALAARFRHRQASIEDSSRRVLSAELGYRQFLPSLAVEAEAALGFVHRSFAAETELTWRAGLGMRFPRHVAVRLGGERSAYLQTSASFSVPLMITTVGAGIDWSPPDGWAGQGAFDVVTFPDANLLQRFSLWLLAPLFRSSAVQLQAGYGFNYQNSRENRFQLDSTSTEPTGTYEPYYTPLDLRSHSVLANARWKWGSSVAVRLSGAVGVLATETPPFPESSTTAPAPIPGRPTAREETASTRSFRPWSLDAALGGPLGPALSWSLEGKYWSTAFYDLRQVMLRLSYRILPAER